MRDALAVATAAKVRPQMQISRGAWRRKATIAAALAALLGWPVVRASAQDTLPALRTNEADIAALMRPDKLAIDDPMAVFAYVLGRLPERVQVYPTENYYYFRFVHDGVAYAGNIRLAANLRDKGEVAFAYGETPSDWNNDPSNRHAALGAAQGVTVERLGPLLYRVSLDAAHGGKSVTFALNDLSQFKPPPGFLRADEVYIGPSFDESGFVFFLVFNRRLKVFHFVLDEGAKVPDQFLAAKASDRIQVGKRSGFAFYRYDGRQILIGVSAPQSRLNTYFDGPFDQLPENFIAGETLREAIVAADPRVKGKIDRLGNYADGSGRYLIHPYLPYWDVDDLAVFHRCATAKSVPAAERPRCFVIDNAEADRPNPRPLALKKR
jgi:hypothetical protein